MLQVSSDKVSQPGAVDRNRHVKKKKGLVQMFDLFVRTCSEYALPGLLFSLLQEHDVSCPKEWQNTLIDWV